MQTVLPGVNQSREFGWFYDLRFPSGLVSETYC